MPVTASNQQEVVRMISGKTQGRRIRQVVVSLVQILSLRSPLAIGIFILSRQLELMTPAQRG